MKYYEGLRSFVAILCWAAIVSSILLQNIYLRPTLDGIGLVLVLLASFLAGFVIVRLSHVLYGWLGAIALSLIITFGVMSLPVFLGRAEHATLLGEEFFTGMLVIIIRATFPFLILETLIASFLGAIVASRVPDNPRIDKIKLVGFAATAIISVLVLLPPTNNYMFLYEAMEKVNMTASMGQMDFDQIDHMVTIPVNFTFHNPTGYSGIAIVSVSYHLYYVRDNGSTLELYIDTVRIKDAYIVESGMPLSMGGEPVEPYSNFSRSYDISLNMTSEMSIFDEMKNLQDTDNDVELILGNALLDVLVAAQAVVFVGRTKVSIGNVPLTAS